MKLKQKLNVLKHRIRWLAIKYEFEIIMIALVSVLFLFIGAVK